MTLHDGTEVGLSDRTGDTAPALTEWMHRRARVSSRPSGPGAVRELTDLILAQTGRV